MKKIITFSILAYLLFTINSGAADNKSNDSENKKLLKIGVLLPLSGEFQNIGESFLKSIRSFKMYVPLELIQRIPNPNKLIKIEFVSVMFKEPTIGMKINKFLYHCFGLTIFKTE